ncbi:MAG: FtsB family cell division protein [Bacteroidota bacterium]|jgi:cell division protein FtsB
MNSGKLKKTLKIIFNKYLITVVALAVWVVFFDRNDIFTQYDLYQQVQKLKAERDYFKKGIENNRLMIQKLNTDAATIEKYAREVHLMKKSDEEVFVIKTK